MREPLRQVYDEAEKRHADPPAAFREVQARIEAPSTRATPLRLVMSTASLALVLMVGRVLFKVAEAPTQAELSVKTIQGKSVEDGPDVTTMLSMCKSFSDADGTTLDWGRAVDACEKVLVADPINIDARKLKKLSEKELAQKKVYDGAKHLYDLGEYQDAMNEYLKVDSDSFYYRLARSEFRTAAPAAMKAAGDRCLAERKAGSTEAAWADCKRMMDVGYYTGLDGSAQLGQFKEAYAELEKRHQQQGAWEPPKDYERFLKESADVADGERQRDDAIKKMYADPEIAEAVVKYASDLDEGMQAIQKYIDKGGPSGGQARQIYVLVKQASSDHRAGHDPILHYDHWGAAEYFRAQLDADAKVMPKGFESDLSKQTRRDISEKFANRGKELFHEGRLPESFESCQGGADFQLGNPSVLECFSDLENKATVLVEQGCTGAQKAMKITRPDSPTHKWAEKVLKDNGC